MLLGLEGQRGSGDDITQAAGGLGLGNAAGDGGAGGYGGRLDGDPGGEFCWPYDSSVGGGGGGAVGRIRVNVAEPYTPASVISPQEDSAAFSQGELLFVVP